jgi:5'-nucleotidase
MLEKKLPEDVHVLNVVVPAEATPETPWKVTPLSDLRYFKPYVEREGGLEEKGRIRARLIETKDIIPGNDIHTVRVEKSVSVTPLSVNLTSRTDLKEFEDLLRSDK